MQAKKAIKAAATAILATVISAVGITGCTTNGSSVTNSSIFSAISQIGSKGNSVADNPSVPESTPQGSSSKDKGSSSQSGSNGSSVVGGSSAASSSSQLSGSRPQGGSGTSGNSHNPSDTTQNDGYDWDGWDFENESESESDPSASSGDTKPPSADDNVTPADVRTINGSKYKRTFFDGFSGTKLDTTKWSNCPEWYRQDVGGQWKNDCWSLSGDGKINIEAKLKANGKPISGAIYTKGKFQQAKGYFEIRCKLQKAPGFWGAFWMMCGTVSQAAGATGGTEIDIFESYHLADRAINQGIHWNGYGDAHKQMGKARQNTPYYDGKFHTYSVLWTDSAYIFYIDGKETCRLDSSVNGFPGVCTQPGYMKITIEFGTWAGKIVNSTLPDALVVDYVAAYQKVN